MEYFDAKKNWPKITPHLKDKELNDILVSDFNKYTYGNWSEKFTYGQFPCDFENFDWFLFHRGRRPAFWKYVKWAACHWLVNFNLRLAMLVKPNESWRILTSSKHSTVWNGGNLLFDFNFQALGVDPDECFELAYDEELAPGEYCECGEPLRDADFTAPQSCLSALSLVPTGTRSSRS